jgi:hypothetical protein
VKEKIFGFARVRAATPVRRKGCCSGLPVEGVIVVAISIAWIQADVNDISIVLFITIDEPTLSPM